MLTCIERSHPPWAVVRLRKLLTSRKHALRRWRADAHYNPMIGASEPASAGTSSEVPIAASENSAPDFNVRHGGRSRHGFPKLNQMPLQKSGQENSGRFISDLRSDRSQCGRELIDLLGCR